MFFEVKSHRFRKKNILLPFIIGILIITEIMR
jgi:hypothetical protein